MIIPKGSYESILTQLWCYYHHLELPSSDECKQLDFHKGILLSGKIGCGKTMLMNALRSYLSTTCSEEASRSISVKELEREFRRDGYGAIEIAFDKKHLMIDDLGLENKDVNHYGNNINLLDEVLQARYELFQRYNIKTHCTTNLSSNNIIKMYAPRTVSRLREMFNIVILPGEDMRK